MKFDNPIWNQKNTLFNSPNKSREGKCFKCCLRFFCILSPRLCLERLCLVCNASSIQHASRLNLLPVRRPRNWFWFPARQTQPMFGVVLLLHAQRFSPSSNSVTNYSIYNRFKRTHGRWSLKGSLFLLMLIQRLLAVRTAFRCQSLMQAGERGCDVTEWKQLLHWSESEMKKWGALHRHARMWLM